MGYKIEYIKTPKLRLVGFVVPTIEIKCLGTKFLGSKKQEKKWAEQLTLMCLLVLHKNRMTPKWHK